MSRPTTIVLTGGGTGGHITPVMAVASALKSLRPDIRLVYIGQKGGALSDIPSKHPAIDAVYTVRAGKFRRFTGVGVRQVFDLPTQLHNLLDAVWVLVGIWQSFWLIRKLQPGVIFTRGGYVSVPVALGGKLNGVPFITHDSDSTPSLANRIIARWAAVHAVGMAPELYPYPAERTVKVGVPVSGEYQHVTTNLQQLYRRELGLPVSGKVLLVTGGGNGADALNKLVAQSARALLTRYPDLTIVQTSGRLLEAELNQLYDQLLDGGLRSRVIVKGFVTDLYRYSGAADVVVARAGASTLAELAIQGKACIVIPASQLSWQEHQAAALARDEAIINLHQSQAAKDGQLLAVVSDLFDHPEARERLATKLHGLAISDAAERLAMVLLDQLAS